MSDQKFTTPQPSESHIFPKSVFKFRDLGEKYGLNGIVNYEIDMHTRVPLSHLMMHKIVTLSPQGEYQKLVKSPLTAIYSAIRYGRYLISRTSGSACGVFGIIGFQLQQHPLLRFHLNGDEIDPSSVVHLCPSHFQLAKWFSLAVGLNCINAHLARTLNTQPDTILTAMKIFSVNQTEKIYRELLTYVPQRSHLYNELGKTYRDWIASYTYEGDNGVLPQKVMADFLLDIKKMSQSFEIQRDWSLVSNLFRALKAPLGLTFEDSTFETMHSHFYLMLLIISTRMNQVFALKIDESDKSKLFFEVWNNIQFYVYPLVELRSHLFVLTELHKVIQNLPSNTTQEATKACYTILRNEAYIKCYAWLAANNQALLTQLSHPHLPPLTWSQSMLASLNDLQIPTPDLLKQLEQQQQKVAQTIGKQGQALCLALCHHDPALYKRLCLQMFGYDTNQQNPVHQPLRARL